MEDIAWLIFFIIVGTAVVFFGEWVLIIGFGLGN